MLRTTFWIFALLLSLDAQAFSANTYITLSGATYVTQGTTQTLIPLTYDPDSQQFPDDKPYTWSSSNTALATVNSDGVVSGVSPGRVTITATGAVTGKSKSTTLTVVPTEHNPLFSITFPTRTDRSFGGMRHFALSPDGSYITVVSTISQAGLVAPDTLEVFYAATGQYLGRAILPYSSGASYHYYGNVSVPVAVPLSFESSVAVVTGIDQWAELVTVGSDPRVALTSPDGAYALISNYGSKTTSLVDLKALRTVATLPYYGAIGFHPDGQRFYIANDSTSTSDAVLYQFSLPGGQLAKSATLGRYSMNLTMRFSADGKTGYTSGSVVAFDCDTLAIKGLADSNLVPNRNASFQTVSYSVIDPDSGTLLALIPLRVYDESSPEVVAVSPDKTRVYTLISDSEVRVYRSLTGGDPPNLDADRVFAWAEQHASYGSLFTQAWQPSQSAGGYYYRHYLSSDSYLGVSGSKLYYLGPASNNALLDLGALSDWVRQAGY